MKKSILFTSLAAAVLSSALVSAEETPVESLASASATDTTVITEEASTTASSETLADILATGTPAASVTEMSETTASSDTASAVTESSSTEPLSEQPSTDNGVVKLDFAKNYVSGGEKSSIANNVVVVMQGGVLSGTVTDLTRNEDGTYKVILSSGQSLTVSADKVSSEVIERLAQVASVEVSKTSASSSES